MLDSYIIEELLRQERQEPEAQQPVIEMPRDDRDRRPPGREDEIKDKPQRGVIVIDL
ncbi:MAG: hypothetical protein R3C68_18645 [Myxococcota bacterium]